MECVGCGSAAVSERSVSILLPHFSQPLDPSVDARRPGQGRCKVVMPPKAEGHPAPRGAAAVT
jgi:hypothetical protein